MFKFYESYCIIYNKKDLAKEVILKYRECIESNRYNDFNNKIEKNLLQVFNSFRFIPKSEIKSLLTDFDKWIMEANQQFRSMLIEQLIQIDKNIYEQLEILEEYEEIDYGFKRNFKGYTFFFRRYDSTSYNGNITEEKGSTLFYEVNKEPEFVVNSSRSFPLLDSGLSGYIS